MQATELLKTSKRHYADYSLSRMYYSAFRPVEGTSMEKEPAVASARQQHLYNVDFLVRRYGYSYNDFEEIYTEDDNLPRIDPKLALAKKTFSKPLDINTADKEQLLRVPGIGPVTAERLASMKRNFRTWREVQGAGVILTRSRPFLSINGSRQARLDGFFN